MICIWATLFFGMSGPDLALRGAACPSLLDGIFLAGLFGRRQVAMSSAA
jgi:hypothetical protein